MLLDVSMSTTTNALTKRLYDEGGRLPGPWLVDADGRASDDPGVLFREPKGALLPLGGQDLGHKGFALALLVEALTSGLAGHGRADAPEGWGASVFLQLIDPGAFAGREAFVRETTRLAEMCHTTPVAAGKPPVRLPGERALARREAQLASGVTLRAGILESLRPWADRLGVGDARCPLPDTPLRERLGLGAVGYCANARRSPAAGDAFRPVAAARIPPTGACCRSGCGSLAASPS